MSNEVVSLRLGASLTTIGYQSFSNNRIESVVVHNNLTYLAPDAFARQHPKLTRAEFEPLANFTDEIGKKAFKDSMAYVQVYDSRTPSVLEDSAVVLPCIAEGIPVGGRGIATGSTVTAELCIFGGHIINPASVTLNYLDAQSTTLRHSINFVGKVVGTTDETITNYYATQGPDMPQLEWLPDYSDYTPESIQAQKAALASYWRIGQTVILTAPSIAGYATPSPATQVYVLGLSTNTHNFVYAQASGSGSGTGGVSQDSELLKTGSKYVFVGGTALMLVFLSIKVGTQKARRFKALR